MRCTGNERVILVLFTSFVQRNRAVPAFLRRHNFISGCSLMVLTADLQPAQEYNLTICYSCEDASVLSYPLAPLQERFMNHIFQRCLTEMKCV